ncbi:hypothetical protein AC792_00565 [Arthrobacter sp. RIT-PI-e]|uniref:hypothetical protein n=1 Tax=Arthrobacter sp. RIT-PI-e TaxID=1681197 RepID=UPI0006760C96|nr:hypothetical protein [Arthrobacter sp. RIT-PI-e]KNC20448.1 hypothetical protein AC792_00565 [Arthrobacter sp. RIT-PI-e]
MFGNTLVAHTLTTINALTPASSATEGSVLAVNYTPTQPPGTEGLTTVIGWILWAATTLLFIYFIFGLVQAGKARRQGDSIEAPLWPLVAGFLVGAASAIWTAVV